MIKVILKSNKPIEQGIKHFTRKVKYSGIMKDVYDNCQFTKPSEIRRKELQKAKYIQKLKDQEEF